MTDLRVGDTKRDWIRHSAQRELASAVSTRIPGVSVKIVDFNERVPFLSQLKTSSQADIFIGMHGAGLTHLLFLPEWAAVFEVYHCEDRGCYSDLARLRGVKYFTWPESKLHLMIPEKEGKHPTNGQTHPKFANYIVDVDTFVQVVVKMKDYVSRHPSFVSSRRRLRRRPGPSPSRLVFNLKPKSRARPAGLTHKPDRNAVSLI
ncbi:unnamed protein product [Caenorhabditis auriculariae]|uniref:EGF domain-specific O-linked N-acetylglucosamine transferase n=1 Tax=Caenorhabditis auriculariae TaxID=2777116 RepID=A0A8S1HL45_9PELO|nr:unnamed protein product [Caenorhabditis auriculariae]